MTKVVFMGTPDFSVPILAGLIEAQYDILAVVTQPDRPVSRKKILHSTPVKTFALQHNLLVLQPEKISGSQEAKTIINLQPDLIITAAFGQFLPESLLNAPKFKALNVHASLLPKYRGGAPVHYALINGDAETGVTIIGMVKKMDAGDIFAQDKIAITADDNVGTMFEKLSLLGRDLLLKMLPDYLAGKIIPVPQKEEAVTFSPNITTEQEQIDWSRSATAIFNQIRGMNPWPIAHTIFRQLRFKIQESQVITDESTDQKAGTIIKKTKQDLWVACGQGTILKLLVVQPAGKKALKINDFLNGAGQNIELGEQFQF